MHDAVARFAVPALVALAGCGAGPRKEVPMQITSADFQAGAAIPEAHTADGADQSPALAWSGAPEGTQAFALIMDDPDAPAGVWTHWVVYDLPGAARGLDADQPRTANLPGGGRQGRNTWGRLGWNGPSPPRGLPHHYRFHLYALARPLGLDPGAGPAKVQQAMAGLVLAEATLLGTYGR